MQDAGDSPPPTGNAARGGKGSAFPPLTASVRTGNGLRPADASESVRGIGAKINAEVCAAKSAQGLLWWIAPVELRGGAENRNGQEQVQKKTAKKSRSNGRVEFSGGGFGSHPYRLDKTVVVLSPIAGPEISLIASSGSRNGLYGKLRLWFRLRVTTSLVRSALRLLVSTPSGCPGFGPGFQPPWIRSAPGPGIIRRAAPARARRHRLPESRPAAWRRAPRTRSRAPAAPRRPS